MPSASQLARDRLEAGRARTAPPEGMRAQRYFSLRLYFLALIAAFVIVAGAAVAFVHIQTDRDARAESFQAASFAAHSAARQLSEDFESLEKSIGGLAATPGIEKVFVNPTGCSLSFGSSPGRPVDLGHVDIIRADGTPMCSSRLPPQRERIGLYGTAPWLKAARERRHLAAPVLDPASGHRVAVLTTPIAGGVVAGFLDLTALGGQLAARYGGDSAVVLVATGDRRTVLARSIEPNRWIGTSLEGTPFMSTPGTADHGDLNGTDRLYGEATVAGLNWVVAVGKDKAAALAAQSRLQRRQFAIIGAGLLLLLAATSMIRRRVALPIAQLGRELRAGSVGGLPQPVSVPTTCPEELRSLAVDINLLVSSVNRELDARRRAAAALNRSEETYRRLFERHPAPMFVYDPETLRFVAVNESAVTTYGYTAEEFLELTIEDLRPREDRAKAVGDGVCRHLRKDGSPLDVAISSDQIEFDGKPARLLLAQDVTEKSQLQQQLQQVYKMEAVGQLAGGIAHDFNNLLTVISGYSVLASDSLASEDAPAQPYIAEVQRAAARAAELTHQLLAYSRQQVLERTSLDLNSVVRDAESLFRRIIREDIAIVTELAEDLGRVLADEGQLAQVLMNLVVNAREAMSSGGQLTIRTRNVFLDEAAGAELWGAPAGEYVVLEVADTGTGMTEEVLDHLFEPFFTTKPVGRGTGLGLSTVFGIVKQSEGYIKAASTPGVGTTFTVYLPRNETATAQRRPALAASTHGGNETILVVEDEPLVRNLIEKILGVRGYVVLSASGAEEALRLSSEEEIDAIVTDVVMPSVSGPELVELLRRDRPGLRALLMSGYASDALPEQGVNEDDLAFIQKPFSADALASRLRLLLDS